MKRIDFLKKSRSREWVGDSILIGAKYRRRTDVITSLYWPSTFTVTEFQPVYFEGIKPEVEVLDIGAEKSWYFPRVVGIDGKGKVTTIGMSRKTRMENGEMKTLDIGNMDSYEPL